MMKKKGVSFDGGPVGYGRPPAEHQFEKGQKPKGSGRRRGTKNYTTIINDLLDSEREVTENGKKTKKTVREVLIWKATGAALQGNVAEIRKYFDLIQRLAPQALPPEPLIIQFQNIDGDELE